MRPLFPADHPLVGPAVRVVAALQAAGHDARFAGGCVRDALLARPIKDIDIATSAPPEAVAALFPGRSEAVGRAFGVMLVRQDSRTFEVATFRLDGEYADGRRPASVRFADAAGDASRRDFTINGLFYDPLRERIDDFVGGRADLAARVVRAIGDPDRRFAEDHLRLLRAVRFAAVLDFALDPATADAARRQAASLERISAERIGAEFTRILLEAPKASRGLDLLLDLGLLAVFLPELVRLKGTPQPPEFHPEGDVWTHTLLMLDRLSAPRDATLAYAALLHDVGKADTTIVRAGPDGRPAIRSPGHADTGADTAARMLRRLRQPEALADDVSAIVRRHMTVPDAIRMRPATLRRFLGARTFPAELALHRLDVESSHGDLRTARFLEERLAAFAAEPVLPPPWVRGEDVLALGIAPGPAVGGWLRKAYDAQLEGRFADREALLQWLRTAVAGGP
jgi:poly(A) polymerase